MTIALILVVVAILSVLGLRYAVRGFAQQVTDPEQILGRTQPIDLLAFQNLIDPEEERYLQERLSGYSLLRVRRARYGAACEYVGMAARNAAVLIRVAQLAQASEQPRVREAGKQLLALATETRILALLALLQLYLARLMPWRIPALGSMAQAYSGMRATLERVVSWQRPELAGRIRAAV
jgi:hypothetical protein